MGSLCWWYDRETFLPPAKTVTHQRNNLLSDIIARKTDNNFKRISNDIAGFGLLGNFEGVNQLQDNLFIREIVTGQHNTAYCRAHETGRNLVCRLLLEKKKNNQSSKHL